MLFEGKFTLKAPIQEVWDNMLKPGTLASCIPGAEKIEAIDDKTYEGVVKEKLGPISVKIKFTQTLTDMDPPRHVKAVGKGADVTKAGTFSQVTAIDLKEIGKGEVEVAYSTNVNLVGRLATFGERIMRAKANRTVDEFIGNLRKKLESQTKVGA